MDQLNSLSWYAIYTRSRHEKVVESGLIERGIEAFLPKLTMKKRWSDRTKMVEEPLFRSYCFARFCLKDKRSVVSQNGVTALVHFKDKYVPIDESVINSLKILIANDLKIDPCPYLKVGERVAIRKGPLKGFEGYITEKRNKNTTLVVSVDALASSVKCITDIDFVDLV